MEITHEFFGREYLIDFDLALTSRGCPARLSGPPEDCYPAEAAEWEIDGDPEVWTLKLADVLRRRFIDGEIKVVTERGYVRDQRLELPDWLRDAVVEWLSESDEVAEMADLLAEEDTGWSEWDKADYQRDCAREDSI